MDKDNMFRTARRDNIRPTEQSSVEGRTTTTTTTATTISRNKRGESINIERAKAISPNLEQISPQPRVGKEGERKRTARTMSGTKSRRRVGTGDEILPHCAVVLEP